jgi:hypothetical protein
MTAAAVWFFRIQLMLWLMLSGGRGLDPETFHGPALVVTSFTQYLIPLLVLELYFSIQRSGAPRAKLIFSAALASLTLLMALGLYATTAGMWFPAVPETAS